MRIISRFKSFGISLLLATGLAACDSPPGPAERAGKQIDQGANEAGKKIGETVDRIGKELTEQSARTAVAVDDTEITAKIKAAILTEPGLKTLQISVDTVKGVVTLSGSVDTPQDSERAAALASAVLGVREVDNRLQPKTK